MGKHTTRAKPAVRIILKPLLRHGARGMQQGRTIWIDPRDPRAAQTLLHELIHMRNESRRETWVIRETARQWKKMAWREKAELLRMFGAARIGGDDE
jgi:hypothetical protein